VKQLRATAIADEKGTQPGLYGLDKPRAVAKLSIGEGKDAFTRTVTVGQAKGGGRTYARRDDSPVVYEVDAAILKDLDKEPFDLQDKQLVRAARDDIRKFVFESAAGKVEVTRTKIAAADGGFPDEQYAVTGHGAAKKSKLSSASYSITSLRAAAFAGPVPKDLAKFRFEKTATLFGDGDKLLARVRVGAEKEGKRYLLVEGTDKIALVEKATVDDWPWTLDDAVEPPPAPGSDAGVTPGKN